MSRKPVTAVKGMPPEIMAELAANWKNGDGLMSVMESFKPVAVVHGTPESRKPITALLVSIEPDGQKAYGLFDDGAGGVSVGMHNLSDMGFPNHVKVEPYPHKLLVIGALWLAKDGVDYINPPLEKKEKGEDNGKA